MVAKPAPGRSYATRRLAPLLFVLCFAAWLGWGTSHPRQRARAASAAQETVEAHAAAAVALGGAAPQLRGAVTKSAVLSQQHWHPRHVTKIQQNFLRWLGTRKKAARGTLSPTIFPGCAVWASHAYKVIFVRHPKAATTSVLATFTLCSEPHAKPSCLEMWNGGHESSSTVKNASAAAIDAMWRDYFVFTVVRNPLARAVSAYKFLLSAMSGEEDECRGLMDWDSFCADPVWAGVACRRHRRCCPFSPMFSFAHIIDQARCMTAEDGGLVVDYVARMEHIDSDMGEVLQEINRRRPAGVPALEVPDSVLRAQPSNTIHPCAKVPPSDRHRVSAKRASFFGVPRNFSSLVAKEASYCELTQFYSGRHEHCLRSIRRAYAADLRLLYPDAAADALQRLQQLATLYSGGARQTRDG